MFIIGERINSSRKSISEAIEKKDKDFLIGEAKLQIDAGADFIDINCATSMDNEVSDMKWLMDGVQTATGAAISIDSPDPKVIDEALKNHKGKPFINSVTGESDKLKDMLDIISGKDLYAIALTMDDSGMPSDCDSRVAMARKMASSLKEASLSLDEIYVDLLVKPISSEPGQAKEYLEAIRILQSDGIKAVGGLSNVSFGLPKRAILNAVFLEMAMEAGIGAAIIDPSGPLMQEVIKNKRIVSLDKSMILLAKAALLGEDQFCMNYITAFREGKLEI